MSVYTEYRYAQNDGLVAETWSTDGNVALKLCPRAAMQLSIGGTCMVPW